MKLVEQIAQWLHENGYVYENDKLNPSLTLERQDDLIKWLKENKDERRS